jgi:arginase family enzyme
MSYPVPGGPSTSELEKVFRFLARTCDVRGISVSTWNPRLDGDGRTERVCMKLLRALLAEEM